VNEPVKAMRHTRRTRRTLGTQLAWEAGLCVAASFLVFVGVALLVLFVDLRHDSTLGVERGVLFDELTEQLLWAAAVAAPIATALAVYSVRRAARRATARVDALITSAAAINVDNIAVRVPESGDDDEIGQLARTLNALLARIEHGVAAQRQFAADASHELRTPLAAIINALEVARSQVRSAAQLEQVTDQCLHDARRMVELVEALLHITRPAVDTQVQPATELQAVLLPLVQRWRQRAPKVQLHIEAPAHLALHVDARALDIVFDNLVSNAVAQLRGGGTVRIRAGDAGAVIRIAVEDEGPGIAPGERHDIFKAFARGTHAADLDGARPGFGLGLSIVRRIVEASHGRIFVDAAYQRGARFVMEFQAQVNSA
jgi:two-component system, OmpR family, sensor kinase